jgi:citrate lyase subunit beta/citryl-CoA lyase
MNHDRRIIRSMSFVPAHDEESIFAAADTGLDAIGMDLEDLTPREQKARAREIFPSVAERLAARGIIVMARTNARGEGQEEDIAAIVCPELHCVNTPKTESAEDVSYVARLLDAAEASAGRAAGSVHIRPVIETAKGVKFAYEIASASDRVTYMGGVAGSQWGDLGATVGVIQTYDGTESHYLRSKVLMDVRAAGVRFPIGGGTLARRDREGFRAFTVENKCIGYTGAYCPPTRDLVEVVNDVFTPTAEEISEWQHLLPILVKARDEGMVAFRAEGRTMDTASIGWITDKLELASRLGLGAAPVP